MDGPLRVALRWDLCTMNPGNSCKAHIAWWVSLPGISWQTILHSLSDGSVLHSSMDVFSLQSTTFCTLRNAAGSADQAYWCHWKEWFHKKVYSFDEQNYACKGPPILQSIFVNFCVCLTLEYDYMCSETTFTQEKNAIFIQLLNPQFLLLLLRMIICNHKKGMKNTFLRQFTMR